MNTESVDCRRIKVPLEASQVTKPGDFAWDTDMPVLAPRQGDDRRVLYIHLPGEATWSAIRVNRGPELGERVWGWDGNEEKPTVVPSIHNIGVWHGHLVAGRLKSC